MSATVCSSSQTSSNLLPPFIPRVNIQTISLAHHTASLSPFHLGIKGWSNKVYYLIISSYPDSPAEISTIDMLLIGDLLRYQNCVCRQLKIKYCQFIVEFAVSLYLCGKQGVTEVMMLLCISNGCLEF